MRILAVNGSARKDANTHILLNEALKGAESMGAQTELIHLYDVDYKGCIGCLGCKVKGSKNLGHCAVQDGLKPILDRIDTCDGIILGSPVYFGDVTAMMRAFLERLFYQYMNADDFSQPYFTGKMKAAFMYTMNAPEGYMKALYQKYEDMLSWYFTYVGTVESAETLQVPDYSRYHLSGFDEAERKERRANVFPIDRQHAYDLGKAMASA